MLGKKLGQILITLGTVIFVGLVFTTPLPALDGTIGTLPDEDSFPGRAGFKECIGFGTTDPSAHFDCIDGPLYYRVLFLPEYRSVLKIRMNP